MIAGRCETSSLPTHFFPLRSSGHVFWMSSAVSMAPDGDVPEKTPDMIRQDVIVAHQKRTLVIVTLYIISLGVIGGLNGPMIWWSQKQFHDMAPEDCGWMGGIFAFGCVLAYIPMFLVGWFHLMERRYTREELYAILPPKKKKPPPPPVIKSEIVIVKRPMDDGLESAKEHFRDEDKEIKIVINMPAPAAPPPPEEPQYKMICVAGCKGCQDHKLGEDKSQSMSRSRRRRSRSRSRSRSRDTRDERSERSRSMSIAVSNDATQKTDGGTQEDTQTQEASRDARSSRSNSRVRSRSPSRSTKNTPSNESTNSRSMSVDRR